MAGLLVSVRSVNEARAARAGGASIVDIKEPHHGSLGCAGIEVWDAVRDAVPAGTVLSIALGELPEWTAQPGQPDPDRLGGIAYRKLGLAGVGPDWEQVWTRLRREWGPGPAWVAVAYSDWQAAGAPAPDVVLDSALTSGDCAAILVDTWDKSRSGTIDRAWLSWFARARAGGLKTALAGGLDEAAIDRLSFLEPDWFAVRGAACRHGDRRGTVDPRRVARLARRVESLAKPARHSP